MQIAVSESTSQYRIIALSQYRKHIATSDQAKGNAISESRRNAISEPHLSPLARACWEGWEGWQWSHHLRTNFARMRCVG